MPRAPKDPSRHVHIRSLRTRFLLPLFFTAIALAGVAAVTVLELGRAARRDAEASMYALAHTIALSPASIPAGLPPEASFVRFDARGKVVTAVPEGQLSSSSDPLVAEVLSRKEGSVTLYAQESACADHCPQKLRIYGFSRTGSGDFVVVSVPEKTLLSSFHRATLTRGILAGAIALIVLALATVFGDMLFLRRIRRLVIGIKEAAAGDVESTRALTRGLGELDQLTDAFQTITSQLQASYDSTEQKVKKRTVELEFNKGMAELERSRTEALLTSVGDGLFATDNEGKISFINQEGERLLGFSAKELVGNLAPVFLRLENDKGEVITPEERPTSKAIKSGETYHSPVYPKPYYFVRKDKTRFPAQITVTPFVAGGSVAGTIQVFRDITAEVEFDRRKSEFISIASHQLRSPLSVTKWLSDMLRKGDVGQLQPQQQELADKMFDANERMVTLVNELLNVSRLESGTIKLAPQETDFVKLVDTVVTDATPLFAEKKQTVKREFADGIPLVTVDQTLLREVTTNLLSNASKYSPNESTVTVGMRVSGDMVEVSVRDQGMGIPQSDQSQMFRKFFRAGNAAKSVVAGTGLGLYVCKAAVELHGGKVWFESEEGNGTTFFYTIPVHTVQIKAGEVTLT